MGELQRLRDAREFRVSRSHVHAALTLSVLLSVVMFGVGFALGRAKVAVTSDGTPVSMVDGVPGQELVELLAEVERGNVLHASQAMTYPQFFAGGGTVEVPTAAPKPAAVDAAVPGAPSVADGATDPLPEGEYTIHVGEFSDEKDATATRDVLAAAGFAVGRTVRLEDGKAVWILFSGSYGSTDEAMDTRAKVDSVLTTVPGVHETPSIVGVKSL
jgi:hypothetical protein